MITIADLIMKFKNIQTLITGNKKTYNNPSKLSDNNIIDDSKKPDGFYRLVIGDDDGRFKICGLSQEFIKYIQLHNKPLNLPGSAFIEDNLQYDKTVANVNFSGDYKVEVWHISAPYLMFTLMINAKAYNHLWELCKNDMIDNRIKLKFKAPSMN